MYVLLTLFYSLMQSRPLVSKLQDSKSAAKGRAASGTTRERLQQATIDLLIHSGLSGVTFVDVAKQAGLSRGAIHHHYQNRTELFEDVIDFIGTELRARVQEQLTTALGADRTLTAMVDFAWDVMNGREYLAYEQIRAGLRGNLLHRQRLVQKMRSVTEAWALAVATLRSDNSAGNSELPRIVLAALAGAASVRNAVGPPAHDPDGVKLRDQLKQLINLAEFSVPLDMESSSNGRDA